MTETNNLCFEVLPRRQKAILDELAQASWISDFYLAGGTALALQIGHRRSIDFDFFTEDKKFNLLLLKKRLLKLGHMHTRSESEDTFNGSLNSISISFFSLPYKLIQKPLKYKNINLANKLDIAAMKLSAVSSRGSRKDFVDLYYLLDEYTLSEMITAYEKKYGKSTENIYCVLKGLVYFVDAEKLPMPRMLKNITWRSIKNRILLAQDKYVSQIRQENL